MDEKEKLPHEHKDDTAMAAVRLLLEVRAMDRQEMQEARRASAAAKRCAVASSIAAAVSVALAVYAALKP